MDKQYELKYHRLEKDYWWFRGRRDIIFRLLRRLDISYSSKIIDLGCSGGLLIDFLKKKGYRNIFGIDISREAILECRKNGIKDTFVRNCINTKFKDEEFDILIASDILEHIETDSEALEEWNRILKTNGILIVFVPAFDFLWSKHDEVNHHYRRYSQVKLVNDLKKHDFAILKISYWNFSLFIPVSFIRIIQRFTSKIRKVNGDQLFRLPYMVNKALTCMLEMENRLLEKTLIYPYGLSVFAVAKKVN
jgi:SAM-dependent methyltransferase